MSKCLNKLKSVFITKNNLLIKVDEKSQTFLGCMNVV
jgi:hypothetical protein